MDGDNGMGDGDGKMGKANGRQFLKITVPVQYSRRERERETPT